jgi:hypothetical protein
VGTEYVIAPEDYCREIEAYLCRKNDGHLIRIVGPAFEQVSGWARAGIPLKVAYSGVDRYFERYYRKGPRRRPVRIEFCEADVRDAFDDWRRAVGVTRVAAAETSAETRESRRSSLAAHIERALGRLTILRGSTQAASALSDTLARIARHLDGMQADARRARGHARAALIVELESLDRQLTVAAVDALPEGERQRLGVDAERELAPFRGRMQPESLAKARDAAFERLVRETYALPSLRYE